MPFGSYRLEGWFARAKAEQRTSYVWLCESELDALTFWLHRVPALGYGGARFWRREWAPHAVPFARVLVVQEPGDAGIESSRLVSLSILEAASELPDPPEVSIVPFPEEVKDANGLHLDVDSHTEAFHERLRLLVSQAIPAERLNEQLTAEEEGRRQAERQELMETAGPLLHDPAVMHKAIQTVEDLGVVGEPQNIGILHLATRSRALKRPANLEVNSPATAGKTHLVVNTLRLEHEEAYYELTAGSERSLIYLGESLEHRILYIQEPEGLGQGVGIAALKSLIWEGRLKYDTVVREEGEFVGRHIEKEGPTGLIVTTTHPLDEQVSTRMIRIEVNATEEQTRRILSEIGERAAGVEAVVDLGAWHALSKLLGEPVTVVVPYGPWLSSLVATKTLRIRRDFTLLITLIQASAVLHRYQRPLGELGEAFATAADYAVVHSLVADLFRAAQSEGITDADRAFVAAVAELSQEGRTPISQSKLSNHVGMSKGAVSYRVRRLLSTGYLGNQEDRKGKPAKLVPGDPLPERVPPLPSPCDLVAFLLDSGGHGLVSPWVHPLNGEHHDCSQHLRKDENEEPSPRSEHLNTGPSTAPRSRSEVFIRELNGGEHLNAPEGQPEEVSVQLFSTVQSPYERSGDGDAKRPAADRSAIHSEQGSDENTSDTGPTETDLWREPL